VVAVTSNEDVCGRLLRRLDSVGEAWAHIRDQKRKGVGEAVGDGAAGVVSVE
jgi:hypothetical protein